MENYNLQFVCMSTPCRVQIYEGTSANAQKCFEEIKKNTQYLEKKYNFYDENSYLSKIINNRVKNKIKVDSQTANVLKIVRQLSINTNNNFDITVGTLKQCYKHDSLDLVKKSLENTISKIGIDSWDINNRFLEFKYDDTILDLGGVIKEYAVDEAVKIIRKHNIKSAIVNFGGDLYVIGRKPNLEKFSIGIKNPNEPQKNIVLVTLEDQSLTTSANYERNFKIEDKEFSHILGKKEQQKDIISATVICDSTLKSGIYSTSFMLDVQIDIPEDIKVVLVDKDLKLHQNLEN